MGMELPEHKKLLKSIEKRFGPVSDELRSEIASVNEAEHLESLLEDLKGCKTMEDVRCAVSYSLGRQAGRVEGLREAIDIVLGVRDDDVADQISEQAFESFDPEELEQLLLLAASRMGHMEVSSN